MRTLVFTPQNATESYHTRRLGSADRETTVLHVMATPLGNGTIQVGEYGRFKSTDAQLILPPKGISDSLRLSFWGVVGFMEHLQRNWPESDVAFQHWTARAIGRAAAPGSGGIRWRIDIPTSVETAARTPFASAPLQAPPHAHARRAAYVTLGADARVKPASMQSLVDFGAMLGTVPAARWAWAVPNDATNHIFTKLARFVPRADPYITIQRDEPAPGDWPLILLTAPVDTVPSVRFELEDLMAALTKKVGWTFDPLAFSRLRIAAMTQNLQPPTRQLAELMSHVH